MIDKKTAIVAFHEEDVQETVVDSFPDYYEVTQAKSVDEMLEKMGIPPDAKPPMKPKKHFDWYFMDINLELPGSKTYEPARRVFQFIEEDYNRGKVKFHPLTATVGLFDLAQKAGIPCDLKTKMLNKIYDMVRE